MKPGDVIRIPKGARDAFRIRSEVGIVVGSISREDQYPEDLEILADGIVHAMGFQIMSNPEAEVIND
jgi:hypothetical protein|tara:strand:- start:249 stop:449 length:201 start_codon:yes stop_codon:yes gene_type:complete